MSRPVDFEDFGDAIGRFFMGKIQRAAFMVTSEVFPRVAADLIAEAQKLTRKVDAIYRGTMIDSWRVTPTRLGLVVGNQAPWASDIEYGRLPGPVDREAIIEWTRVKLFGLPPRRDREALPGASNRVVYRPAVRLRYRRVGVSKGERAAIKAYKERLRTGPQGLEQEARLAGERIAASIEAKGTEPRFILRDAMRIVPKRLRHYAKRYLPSQEVPF